MKSKRDIKSLLPALVFGERSANYDNSVESLHDSLNSSIPGLFEYTSLISPKLFQHRSAKLTINGMSLIASASSPTRIKVSESKTIKLIIPFVGEGNLTINGQVLHWQASSKAILLSKYGFSMEGSAMSMLTISLDARRLEMTARNMLGLESDALVELDLKTPRVLNIQIGRMSLDTIFRQLANLLDEFSLQPELIELSGIDEVFYRNIAMMCQPTLFLDASTSSPNRKYARRLLDRTCQYISAHLIEVITLKDLDRVACMSRRKLHYEFLKRYNCTPMQWIRSERLLLAHSQLIKGVANDTVTNIALACGFSKTDSFSGYYLKYFGELPSATLRRAKTR